MKNLYKKTGAKLVATILLLICGFSFVGSSVGIYLLDNEGFYSYSKRELKTKADQKYCDQYSITAMSDYQNDFNLEKLNKTNFAYGVIKADNLKHMDLNDDSNYLVKNFTEKISSDDVNIYSCNVDENTTIHTSDSVFRNASILNFENSVIISYKITGYYYDINQGKFYICSGETGNTLYPVESDITTEDGYNLQDYMNSSDSQMSIDRMITSSDTKKDGEEYIWKNPSQILTLDDYEFHISESDIQIVKSVELAEIGDVSDNNIEHIEGGMVCIEEGSSISENSSYYVISFVKRPMTLSAKWYQGDLFQKSYALIDFGFAFRYAIIVCFIFSIVFGFGSLIFLLCAAGHSRENEAGVIQKNWIDKIPLDVHGLALIIAEYLLIDTIILVESKSLNTMVLFFTVAACLVTIGMLLALEYCLAFAVNVKVGKWWKNTLIYRIIHYFCTICGKVSENLSLYKGAAIIYGVICLVEFIVMNSVIYVAGSGFMLWLIEKVLLAILMIKYLSSLKLVEDAAKNIADGAMEHQIPTDKLLFSLKQHGKNLNQISNGMNRAVNDRMKSERFKTELITNVSHDIKTPLTSIINYVDLLQKEQLDNKNAAEYLEVLSRQSARLKKLIEDLMEASKASTGNLNVDLEPCDLGVMLTQTLGEFEEKMKQNEIDLVIQKPEEEIKIMADSRHLWRVLDNLMNNICKYAQSSTRAYINLNQDHGSVEITFRNISKYPLNISSEELLERFVRGDSSRYTEGSGLGLSIAQSLTELMGGSFRLVVDGDLFKVILKFSVAKL